jgi:GH35 family endo-1,4-beta-xylanase/enterochelin esterase-like enzyme
MSRIQLSLLVFAALQSGRLGVGQTNPPADDWKPATSNVPGQGYPRINSELRAQFRVNAPQATSVAVNIGRPLEVLKGDDGVWTITTSPLVVGFHYYQLIVDGVSVSDPAGQSFFGTGKMSSAIEVPSKGEDFYEPKDVPHGQVRERWYYSASTKAWRRCFVYTPPDYDASPGTRYPVLYLQHGGGEDERGWPTQGRTGFILDNLIAEGKAKPMLVVMDNGSMGGGFGGGGRQGGPPGGGFRFDFGQFERILLEETIPMIDSTYRTIANREHRGMAGLSMGGMQVRTIGLGHLDRFSHIGIFSGGTLGELSAPNGPLANAAEFNRLVHVAFVSYGSAERGANDLKGYHDSLAAAGIKNMSHYISPGTAHEWLTWRRSLHEFAPLLFQERPAVSAPAPSASVAAAAPPPQAPEASAPAAPTFSGTIRIKAGVTAPFKDSSGNVWQAERGFEGGATIDRDPSTAIAGTKDPGLFLSEHYSMTSFSLKLPNGKYVAKLYFAETFEGITGPGQRVFSYNVQGREFKDFDIWAKTGGANRAYVETVPLEVADGEFKILFKRQIENPEINAIEIIPAEGGAAVPAPALAGSQSVPPLKDVFKGHFLIGGALNRSLVTGKDSDAAAIAAKHFSTATPENDLKWQLVHPRPNDYDWEPADRYVDFCEKHQIVPIGHCLVWHGQIPPWVFRDDAGNALARDALLSRMKDHISTVVGRYKGRIKGWDVVNEALNEDGTLRGTQWLRIIGEGAVDKQYDHIENAFRFAHQADPDAELYYNDYSLETSKPKCDGAVAIVKRLRSKGLRIDGVGIQMHAGLTNPSAAGLEYAITSLAACGIKVMITELDIRTQARGYRGADIARVNRESTSDPNASAAETQKKLAEKYAEIFSVLIKHQNEIARVTFWGVYDGASWIGGSPLLFDRNYQPKEAFFAVVKTARVGRQF